MPSREEGIHGPSVAAVDVARDLLGVRWTPPARDKGAKRPRGSNEGAKRQGVSGRGSEAAVRPSVGCQQMMNGRQSMALCALCTGAAAVALPRDAYVAISPTHGGSSNVEREHLYVGSFHISCKMGGAAALA